MTPYEYNEAKAMLSHLEREAKNSFRIKIEGEKAFASFLEALITVKGHAWCMDVKSERKKMSKLISRALFS